MLSSTISSKGQTTLPKPIRQILGIVAGGKVNYLVFDGEVRILPVRPIGQAFRGAEARGACRFSGGNGAGYSRGGVRGMIALDTNVLVRYLVCDDPEQGVIARKVLENLARESPGFISREVVLELVWVLERAYKCSRDEIAMVLEELTATEHLVVEASLDVVRCAVRYREERCGFCRPDDSGGCRTGWSRHAMHV